MSKAELVTDFRRNAQKLLADGAKKSWIQDESELAYATLTQILEWGDGPELIPMKASTLAKMQDFNKRYAMGGIVIRPASLKKKTGRSKKAKEIPTAKATIGDQAVSRFFGEDNSKDEVVKIPHVDNGGHVRQELNREKLDQIKEGLKKNYNTEEPGLSIDKAIVMLNQACKDKGITCKVIMEAV